MTLSRKMETIPVAVFLLFLVSISPALQADIVTDSLNQLATPPPPPQSIVVTLKQDPATEDGHEAACVAVQLSMLLQMNGADVTLFVTLGGARLADKDLLERDIRTCTTSQGEAPLSGLVNNFIAVGGGADRILICPLCWGGRYGFEESAMANIVEGAYMGNAASMAETFLGADKILDF